jgi:hypothetical protein
VPFLQAHPSCGFVFSACDNVGELGEVLFCFDRGLEPGVQPRPQFLRELYRRNFIPDPSVLARRSAVDAVRPAMSKGILYYDYEFWLRLAVLQDVAYVGVADCEYLLHSGQTSHGERGKVGDHRLRLLDQVEPLMAPYLPAREIRRARACALLYSAADAARSRQPQAAFRALGGALRTYPPALVDPVVARLVVGSLRQQARQRAAWKRAKAASSGNAERPLEVVG